MSQARPDLDARYGRRRPGPSRRILVTGLAALLAAAIGWFGFLAQGVGNPAVTWQDISFSIPSAGSAQLTFEVTFAGRLDDDARAVCTLNAQNELHTDVGLRDVTVGPAPEGRIQVTASLPTSELATTVLIRECVLA